MDGYDYIKGNKKAAEEHFPNKNKPLLNYIDRKGRIAIKVDKFDSNKM